MNEAGPSSPAAGQGRPIPDGVSYGLFWEAWQRYADTITRLVDLYPVRSMCEIGGGANPTIPLTFVRERGVEYTILDISRTELDKAPAGYRTVVADICSTPLPTSERFDLIFSKMLAEHVPSGRTFHENVLQLLNPGGLAFHFFPTLYAPTFVANRLLPERLSSLILSMFSPREQYRHAKFPTHYSWCRGPTEAQLRRFRSLGYTVLGYRGFFGHEYYDRVPVLRSMSARLARYLCTHPLSSVTSFAWVLLQKPRP